MTKDELFKELYKVVKELYLWNVGRKVLHPGILELLTEAEKHLDTQLEDKLRLTTNEIDSISVYMQTWPDD